MLSLQKVIGPEAVARVMAKTGGLCKYCDAPLKRIALDHVIPTSSGGADDESNLVPCCGSCNSSKRNKDLDQWHRFLSLRRDGIPKFITVRIMDWLIDNDLTTYRYPPYPWGD